MGVTKIEWTATYLPDGTKLPGYSFNSWTGCVECGTQCTNCYAREMSKRFGKDLWGVHARRSFCSEGYWAKPLKWEKEAEESGVRRKVFAHSMSDWAEVLHNSHPDYEQMEITRGRLFDLILKTPHLDWLLLTKRIGNVARIVHSSWMKGSWPKNANVGCSVGNQMEADRDVPKLKLLPAPMKFLSIEPQLSYIDLHCHLWEEAGPEWTGKNLSAGVDWILAGGESGPNARPSHPDWFRNLRDQCIAAQVPFFFKQWGAWWPLPKMYDGVKYKKGLIGMIGEHGNVRGKAFGSLSNDLAEDWQNSALIYKCGKLKSGRLLDEKEWNEMPEGL